MPRGAPRPPARHAACEHALSTSAPRALADQRVGHAASEARCAWVTLRPEARSARGMVPNRSLLRGKSSEAFSSLLKFFISSSAWLRMKCSLGAMAPTGAAYPAAPRARSNLVRLANAAEKRAHAVGPTQRYVTRASPLPSPTPFSPFARFVRSHGGRDGRDPKGGRLDARHANHANLRPTSSPFVAWTRFVAARALENGPRPPRAPRMTARDAARFFESQTVNCFTCETTDDSYVRK